MRERNSLESLCGPRLCFAHKVWSGFSVFGFKKICRRDI